jgi:hypothetical protein
LLPAPHHQLSTWTHGVIKSPRWWGLGWHRRF